MPADEGITRAAKAPLHSCLLHDAREYLHLLSSVGALYISHCPDENEGWTQLEIFGPHSTAWDGPRSGPPIDDSPCFTMIEINGDGSMPSSGPLERNRYWVDVTPLQGEWYLKRRCATPRGVHPPQ